jgi:DNA-binding NtrC family response regulator
MRILIADDDPTVLKYLERCVASLKAPDGQPIQIAAVPGLAAALQAIKGPDRYDVVVTDMIMGEEEKEGLQILRQLTDKSPITIVLTAYPTIPNCVAAMRAGAWDYLEKMRLDGKDPYDVLLESIREALEVRAKNPELGKPNPDSTWISEHLDELATDYPGEVVAVLDQKVVGHSAAYETLRQELAKEFPYARPAMIFIPSKQEEPSA